MKRKWECIAIVSVGFVLGFVLFGMRSSAAQSQSEEIRFQPQWMGSEITQSSDLLPFFGSESSDHITTPNDLGLSLLSSGSIDTRAVPGAFSKISPFNSAQNFPTNPTLSWELSSGADFYELCYYTSPDDSCDVWVNVGTTTSKTLSGLAPNKTYYWHVRAKNNDGETYSNNSETAYWYFRTSYLILPDDGVVAMAIQADGKLLIGGYFTEVNGEARNHIARLHINGYLDTDFNPDINGRVDAIAIQPDGKILVGGDFTKVGTTDRNHLARLNPNGTVDDTFNPNANNAVYAIALQPDGKILIGGAFTQINSTSMTYLARLEEDDGSLDPTFNNNVLSDIVRTIAIQTDGMILIGGAFKEVSSESQSYIARLDKEGVIDITFDPDFDNFLMTLVLQPDGNILVGGQFETVNGEPHKHIIRLEPTGEIDETFLAQANDSIVSIALQADGKMILGGYFTIVNGETHNHILRLDAEGNVDESLYLDANALVISVALQPNGMILVGGLFTQVNGENQSYFARLQNTRGAISLFVREDSSGYTIVFRFLGAKPQFQRVTYELAVSTSTDYSMLGDANYDGSDWVLTGVTLPKDQELHIRTRGYYSTGRFNGSGSISQIEGYLTIYNEAPLDIDLSDNFIEENQPENTVVGTFSTSDPDAGDTFTYSFVPGTGDTDNASFNILGDDLRTSEEFDYETKNSYSIRVRSTDQGGLYTEKVFTILVTDVDDEEFTESLIYLPLLLK